jgi:outer membrane protein assembly factor BamB
VRWNFETNRRPDNTLPNDGCGGVWSSGTVDPVNHLVMFDVADCDFDSPALYSERVFALHLGGPELDGTLAWVFTPPRIISDGSRRCDWDFGATVNLADITTSDGPVHVAGVGGKDGTYYLLNPADGTERWERNVVFGGVAGGFIATTALDATRAYGATALGDFGSNPLDMDPNGCTRGDIRDLPVMQEPSMHAFDVNTGAVAWQQPLSQSFGPTTVANGLVYTAATFIQTIQIRDAQTGVLVKVLPALGMSASGITVGRNSLYYGTGVFFDQTQPTDGIYAWTSPLAS